MHMRGAVWPVSIELFIAVTDPELFVIPTRASLPPDCH
jgi:hypothetical protein